MAEIKWGLTPIHTDPNYNRISSMTDGIGTTSYTYYAVGASPTLGANQVRTIDGYFANDILTYTYDQLGRATGQDINGTPASVSYDALGRMSASSNALGSFTRAYDGVTPLQSMTYPNGQTAGYSYFGNSGDRRLQTLAHQKSNAVNLSSFTYSYDPVGTITAIDRTLGTMSRPLWFEYDDGRQLARVTNKPNPAQATSALEYSYDLAGNRTSDANYNPSVTYDNGVFKVQLAKEIRVRTCVPLSFVDPRAGHGNGHECIKAN